MQGFFKNIFWDAKILNTKKKKILNTTESLKEDIDYVKTLKLWQKSL